MGVLKAPATPKMMTRADVGDGSPRHRTLPIVTGSTYNDCDDLSDTLYIHVFRNSHSSNDCATFELEITNG